MYFKGFCCPKLGQGFKPSAAILYPNIGRVLPPPQSRDATRIITYKRYFVFQSGIKVYNLVTIKSTMLIFFSSILHEERVQFAA